MSHELIQSAELHDALRRLERAVGPAADAAETKLMALPRPHRYRQVRLRTALLATVAAAFAGALLALPLLDSTVRSPDPEPIGTVAVAPPQDAEIARLRSALADAEEAQSRLRAELEEARKPRRGVRWFEDTQLLMYRHPWPSR